MTETNHLFIAVNYKTSCEVKKLVESFLRQKERNWRLIIKDNSEDDIETSKLVKIVEQSEKISLHSTNNNVGYFPAATRVLGSVDPLEFATVSVCNVDLSLGSPSFIANLNALEALPADVMVIAPDLYAINKQVRQNPFMVHRPRFSSTLRRRLMFANRTTSKLTYKAFRAKVMFREFRRKLGQPVEYAGARQYPSEIYAPHGAFVTFRRSFFIAGNTVEHPLRLFAEELTVAEQVRASAGKVMFCPSLSVLHRENASMGGKKSNYILDSLVDAGRYGYSLYAKPRKPRL